MPWMSIINPDWTNDCFTRCVCRLGYLYIGTQFSTATATTKWYRFWGTDRMSTWFREWFHRCDNWDGLFGDVFVLKCVFSFLWLRWIQIVPMSLFLHFGSWFMTLSPVTCVHCFSLWVYSKYSSSGTFWLHVFYVDRVRPVQAPLIWRVHVVCAANDLCCSSVVISQSCGTTLPLRLRKNSSLMPLQVNLQPSSTASPFWS